MEQFKLLSKEEIIRKNKEHKLNFSLMKFGYDYDKLKAMSYAEKIKLFQRTIKEIYG